MGKQRQRLGLRGLVCRLRGHEWQTAEVTGYRPDGRLFVRGNRRFCTRCPARDDVAPPV